MGHHLSPSSAQSPPEEGGRQRGHPDQPLQHLHLPVSLFLQLVQLILLGSCLLALHGHYFFQHQQLNRLRGRRGRRGLRVGL